MQYDSMYIIEHVNKRAELEVHYLSSARLIILWKIHNQLSKVKMQNKIEATSIS